MRTVRQIEFYEVMVIPALMYGSEIRPGTIKRKCKAEKTHSVNRGIPKKLKEKFKYCMRKE
jgi:hypothetical protein